MFPKFASISNPRIKYQASPETTRNEMSDNVPTRWKAINLGFRGEISGREHDKKATEAW